jgi:hypothetical protein
MIADGLGRKLKIVGRSGRDLGTTTLDGERAIGKTHWREWWCAGIVDDTRRTGVYE